MADENLFKVDVLEVQVTGNSFIVRGDADPAAKAKVVEACGQHTATLVAPLVSKSADLAALKKALLQALLLLEDI